MNEAIEKRISHRCFSKEPVRASDVLQIQKWTAEVNEESGLDIEYLADGSEAFNGIKKSYGMFSNVRSMLVMKGCSDDETLDVKIGYYGEDLVLKMTQLNLGTCWVGGTYDSSSFSVPDGEALVCVIVFGTIRKTIKDVLIRAVIRSKNRKSIEERTVADAKLPEEVINGMEAVRLAPSAVNRQAPTLHYAHGQISMDVDASVKFNLVDLGIAMRHFEIGAGAGNFELKNGGLWTK